MIGLGLLDRLIEGSARVESAGRHGDFAERAAPKFLARARERGVDPAALTRFLTRTGREPEDRDWATMREGASSRRKATDDAEMSARTCLSALAATRRALPVSHPLSRALGASVLTFGLPDLAQISGGASERRRRLADVMAAAAPLFDPRLAKVRAEIEKRPASRPDTPFLAVTAVVATKPAPRALAWRARIVEGRIRPETSDG